MQRLSRAQRKYQRAYRGLQFRQAARIAAALSVVAFVYILLLWMHIRTDTWRLNDVSGTRLQEKVVTVVRVLPGHPSESFVTFAGPGDRSIDARLLTAGKTFVRGNQAEV